MQLKIADGVSIEDITKPEVGKLEHAHCSGVVAFKNGEILVVYYHALKEAERKQAIYGRRLMPSDKKWEDAQQPYVVSKDIKDFRMEGNPVVWIAPDTGILWLIYSTSWGGWSTCIMRSKTSNDQGVSWSKSKKIYPHISRVPKNPPILISNGDYVLPATIEFRECMALFYLSHNQGKKWIEQKARLLVDEKYWPNTPQHLEKSPQLRSRMLDQPTIIERKDGSIFCLMRAYRPLGKMFESTSNDGGKTWSIPKPGILPNPDGGFNMIKLASGNIAIIYNHSSTARNPLSIALSEDDGKTWKYRRNICEFHPDPEDKSKGMSEWNFQYPTLCQGPDGRIHITWSFGHDVPYQNGYKRVTDIQYCSITEDWIKQQKYSESEWLLN